MTARSDAERAKRTASFWDAFRPALKKGRVTGTSTPKCGAVMPRTISRSRPLGLDRSCSRLRATLSILCQADADVCEARGECHHAHSSSV